MNKEQILYTDGRNVTVTDSAIKVKKKWYSFDGISGHSFSILQPDRLPCILILVSGLCLIVVGGAGIIPAEEFPDVYMGDTWISINQMSIGFGLFLVGMSLIWWTMRKDMYAVRITTAEGEKNVVVSERKEYINQIIHALNEGFFHRVKGAEQQKENSGKKFMVSGR